jgi:diaminohydroxyphosphoribosylaminopyrimidine deaminase/5-amino-6-(5-phosphoribosylamino)uracil reductase
MEPCDHTGLTGPCTEALLVAGITRVVYGQRDPNPLAAGGAARLREAGIDVEGGVLAGEAQELNAAWTLAIARGRPVVTWKFAGSLDGRAAAADGTSQWITGEPARRDVARLRGDCDAILVGTGTALADDPHLTVRGDDGQPLPPNLQPLRVVLGRREIPDSAHLRDAEARTIQLDTHDPDEALAALHEQGIRHVWLEGGPTVAGAFVRAGLVDEVIAYVAPLLLGDGLSVLGDAGIATLTDGLRLSLVDVTRVGDDVRLTYFRRD